MNQTGRFSEALERSTASDHSEEIVPWTHQTGVLSSWGEMVFKVQTFKDENSGSGSFLEENRNLKLWWVEDTQMWFTALPSKPLCDGKPWLKIIWVTHQREWNLTHLIAHCAHMLNSGPQHLTDLFILLFNKSLSWEINNVALLTGHSTYFWLATTASFYPECFHTHNPNLTLTLTSDPLLLGKQTNKRGSEWVK